MNNDIKVMYGDIKRETVLIDPSIPVNMSGGQEAATQLATTNIIAEGTSSREILKKIYGR